VTKNRLSFSNFKERSERKVYKKAKLIIEENKGRNDLWE